MDKKTNSNIGFYLKILLIIIVLIIAYILLPKSWSNMGDTYRPRTADKSGSPTPTSLQFRDPFKYDNYKPQKKIESKPKEQGQKNKSLFWKEK